MVFSGKKGSNNSCSFFADKRKIGIFLVVVFSLFSLLLLMDIFLQFFPIGWFILDLQPRFIEGEQIKGNVNLIFSAGELIPVDSLVYFQLGSQEKVFQLADLITSEKSSGNFYAENSYLSGNGEGYGLIGEKRENPVIEFKLKISSLNDNSEESIPSDPVNETIDNSSSVVDSSESTADVVPVEPVSEVVPVENPVESVSETSPSESSSDSGGASVEVSSNSVDSQSPSSDVQSDSSNSDTSSSETLITGAAISSQENIVSGSVSKGNDYFYNLVDGESYELVADSVTINGESVNSDLLRLTKEGNRLIVSTDYELVEKGFGKDFLGSKVLTLSVPLENLNLTAEENAPLNVNLIYQDNVLASVRKDLIVIADEKNETVEQPVSNISIVQVKDIPTIRIKSGENTSLDLSDYFSNAESYGLNVDNVSEVLDGSILTLIPEEGFKGSRKANIIAYRNNRQEILESNQFLILVSSGAVNINVEQGSVRVGEQVKWTVSVSSDVVENISLDVPVSAENISVVKIDENGKETSIDAKLVKTDDNGNEVVETVGSDEKFNSLTGNVIADVSVKRRDSIFVSFFKNIFSITGRVVDNSVVSDTLQTAQLNIDAIATNYTVEYYTEAPKIAEENISGGKEVTVYTDSELGYTDVLAFTDLNESLNVGQENALSVYWVENNSYLPFDAYDLDDNGKLDYIEWVVPHLSNQTFEIILISKADKLNSDRNFIEDVYDSVKELDGIFVSMNSGEYLRVTFEKKLIMGNDMMVYASGNGNIFVYNENENDIIGEFNINSSEIREYKIYPDYTDAAVYDLLFTGEISVDYIVDPTSITTSWTGAIDGDLNNAGNWDNGVPTSNDTAIIDNANFTGNKAHPTNGTCLAGTVIVTSSIDQSPYYADIDGGTWSGNMTFNPALTYWYQTITNGTFNGNINGGLYITGGEFHGTVTADEIIGGVFYKNVHAVWIADGIFYGNVTIDTSIADGTFYQFVTNTGTINSGNFCQTQAETGGTINGGTFNINDPLCYNYVSLPNITNVLVINQTGVSSGTTARGDNITIDATVENTTGVEVIVWQNVIGGPIWIMSPMNNSFGNLWEVTFGTNSSFNFGQVNYTVYANNSLGQQVNFSGNLALIENTNLIDCMILGQANTVYTLQNNISTNGTCFNITADNVTLDLGGFTVQGNTPVGDYEGITVDSRNNITIGNGFINNFTQGTSIGLSLSSVTNSKIENITITNNRQGIYVYSSTNNFFSNIYGLDNYYSFILQDSTNGNTVSDMTLDSNYAGIYIGFSENNIFYNLQSYNSSSGLEIEEDLFMPSPGNMFFYNNSFGKISFVPLTGNINSDIKFGVGQPIQISNNSAYVNSTAISELNVSANVTLYGIGNRGFAIPAVFKDGSVCTDCYNFTPLNANTVVFNVSSWSNYTIGDVSKLTTCGVISQPGVYTLQNNVSTTGTCFNITSDNVALDLNGYTITGADISGENYGVYANGKANLNIYNGTISSFGGMNSWNGDGIFFENVVYSTVSNVFLLDNFDAIALWSSNYNNLSNISSISNNFHGLDLSGSSYNLVYNLTSRSNQDSGIYVNFYSNHNIFYDIVSVFDSNGVFFDSSSNNIFYNLQSYSTTNSRVSALSSSNNTLIYNNSFGKISFVPLTSNINSDIKFGVGQPIQIANGSAYVNTSAISGLNISANITFYGLPTKVSEMYNASVLFNEGNGKMSCANCNILSSSDSDSSVTFNVSDFGNSRNYSVGGVDVVSLNAGWNSVSFIMDGLTNSSKNISVSAGWNLIGLSGESNVNVDDLNFTNSGGTKYKWSQAVTGMKMQDAVVNYDSSSKRFKIVRDDAGNNMSKGKGYWVYAREAGNLTLPNVRSSGAGKSYRLSELMFSNGTSEMNLTNAVLNGWVEDSIYRYGWDDVAERYKYVLLDSSESISSLQGYFIHTNSPNVAMSRKGS